MSYGAPTHRLEEYMRMSARVLEVEGQFLYIPGCMIISFDDSGTHVCTFRSISFPISAVPEFRVMFQEQTSSRDIYADSENYIDHRSQDRPNSSRRTSRQTS